jgi:cyanophycinase-like exopeptidase
VTAPPRILCLMGSGETAPTMAPVHRELLERMGGPAATAALLDTPFGFQENADELVARAQEHFARSIGGRLELASLRSAEATTEVEKEAAYSRIQSAAYVFSGPGSPSYALRTWRSTEVPRLLRAKLEEGGCLTFASAAAICLGVVALPVYEIYKVGEPVRWLEGLDVLGAAGLRAAVVTHWDNAEGGTHDTRYCYMGAARLARLEEMLPEGAAILGIDEHTALVLDLGEGRVRVRGRGTAVVRCHGADTVIPSGAEMGLEQLRGLLAGDASAAPSSPGAPRRVESPPRHSAPEAPFTAMLAEREDQFDRARDRRDAGEMVGAILGLDTAMAAWSGETFSGDERDRARALLRRMVTRLGEIAASGAADPRELLAPLVEGVLRLRRQFRDARRYAEADQLRDLLVECGVEVRDGPAGEPSAWGLAARADVPGS